MKTRRAGLLVCGDLFMTSKVTSTAQALGFSVRVAASLAQATAAIADGHFALVFIDLNAGAAASADAIAGYRIALGPDVPIVAFGSHVDQSALAAAAAAGCDEAWPRSKFSIQLAELLRAKLDQDRDDQPGEAS